jgi:hypothetical protein
MEKSRRFSIMIALVVIAFEIGAYIYAALFFRERFHIFLITLFLCGLGGFLGGIVTRPKALAISVGIMLLGLIALGVGVYLLHAFRIHERAYAILGIGFLCFVGGLAGITIKSMNATLNGMIVLGFIALGIGLYFLVGLNYHGRAYILLGIGTFGILGSLIMFIIIRFTSHRTVSG